MILTDPMADWTQAQIDALRAAVASGVLTVRFVGGNGVVRETTYQSLAEMRSLLAEMTASTSAGTPYRLAATRKGL